MAQQTKVSVNIQQDFNEDQQKQARDNIGSNTVTGRAELAQIPYTWGGELY